MGRSGLLGHYRGDGGKAYRQCHNH
jgi:hypothetical protein